MRLAVVMAHTGFYPDCIIWFKFSVLLFNTDKMNIFMSNDSSWSGVMSPEPEGALITLSLNDIPEFVLSAVQLFVSKSRVTFLKV